LHDLSGLGPVALAETLQTRLDAEAARPFDLAADLFLRAQLLRLADDEHVLLLTLHHIAADGWSMVVLLKELATLYEARIAGVAAALPPLPLQYADYAHWQRQWLQGERLEAQLRYWQGQLAGLPTLHNLPLDFPRPDTQRYRGALHRAHLPSKLLVALTQLSRAHDATLFMTLQLAFAVLLSRWSGATDIVVGTPIANRRHEELAPLIGFFVNTLVLRTDLSTNPRFIDALAAAREVALDAYQHQDLPFEMLVDRLRPQRSLSHSPLFQVMFTLDNNDAAVIPFGGLEVDDIAGEFHHAKFDLTLNLQETRGGLEACWDYNRDLFRADTIARMAASFETLLHGIAAMPAQPVGQLPLLDAAMQHETAALSGQAATPSFDPCCLHTLVERQVERSPDAIAVTFEEETLTYAQLNQHANQLARHLRKLGVGPDVRVAIAAERGLAMVTGLLAILKAGGAYVPLDPAYPADRLAYMLEDSAPAVLLAQQSVLDKLPATNLPTLLIDDASQWRHAPGDNLEVGDLTPGHLAYVIYTSGSTGRPKGVMNEHRGIVNRLLWAQSEFQLSLADRVLQKTPFGFDVSVWEFFLPLLTGAQLVMARPGGHQDPDYLARLIESAGITMLHFVPSMLQAFLDGAHAGRCHGARHVLCSGEALPHAMQARFHKALPDVALHNLYGPTEAAVDVTHWRCDPSLHPGIVPIGRPVAHTRMYVLDSRHAAVPRGVAGELYIGGIQVARGYLNRPELTAERFIADPFVNDPDARLYKTGDMGRWLPDGSIEYLGRNDFQVKIRGFRIELGEIEAALAACAGIREAVVIAREDVPGEKRLVAYLLMHEGCTVAPADLRQSLAQSLPDYMVPNAFLQLTDLPLTPNGKLDRQALPVPDGNSLATRQYEAPQGAMETTLVALWQDLLKVERIGRHDHFFDLGGHSLSAVRLMSSIREATGKVLPISILFKAPTIRALAARIGNHGAVADESFVTLRGQGERAPLFVFHAAGGDVLCYQPLLQHLAGDMPVHGFHRSELPNQRVPELRSIEQLADEYLPRLLQEQPDGSFYLAGWSSGGLIALEMAARLEKLGRQVAIVMLVDTMLPTGTDVPLRFHQVGLAGLAGLAPQAACDLMREFEPTLPELTPKDGMLDVPATDYFNYLVAANQIGLDFYQPDFRLASRVHYFGCTLNRNVLTEDQRIAELQTLVVNPITRDSFEATHFSIMEEPHASELGRAMDALIELLRSRRGLPAWRSAESSLEETIA
jgi:amino acid adenylation domain-containing protein